MEIYDNFQINDLVDITIYENHDWGCPHNESIYATDLDTLKLKIRSQFPKAESFRIESGGRILKIYL